MKVLVPIQMVPDLVEELEIDDSGAAFDLDYLAWIVNEFDDHAVEQAILLKEDIGAEVIIVSPDFDEIDDALYTAGAKGADRLIKIAADYEEEGMNNHALAGIFTPLAREIQPDLILTGVSNHNGMDGSVGALLAEKLGFSYVGYVSNVEIEGGKAIVEKDYPGGLKAKLEVTLPAVLGISSANKPPRYVPISKVRQAMKTTEIEEQEGELDLSGAVKIEKMYAPEVADRAEMIKGDVEEIAQRLVEILKDQDLI